MVGGDARPLSVDALKVLRFWLANTLEVSCRTRLNFQLEAELGQHLQRFIAAVLQREVKSYEWLERLRNERLLTAPGEAPTIARRPGELRHEPDEPLIPGKVESRDGH